MTESEWLASEDPGRMLEWLENTRNARGYQAHRWDDDAKRYDGGPSPRKLRLFAVACARPLVGRPARRDRLESLSVAERFADGEATEGDLRAAEEKVESFVDSWACVPDDELAGRLRHIIDWDNRKYAARCASLLRDIVGNPFRPVTLKRPLPWLVTNLALAAYEERSRQKQTCPRCEGESIGKLLGCPDCQNRGYVLQSDGTLDPHRLAVLADALEEAGCTEEALLMHLRGVEPCPDCFAVRRGVGRFLADVDAINLGGKGKTSVASAGIVCGRCRGGWIPLRGPHVRGCHALDLVLGKA